MSISITLPALTPTMTEATLIAWLVSEGDVVEAGAVVAEVETDKAVLEILAPAAGKIRALYVAAGTEGVAVGAVIGEINAGDDCGAARQVPDCVPASIRPVEPAMISQDGAPARNLAQEGTIRVVASPLARRLARERGVDLRALRGSGPGGRIIRRDLPGQMLSNGSNERPDGRAVALRRTLARKLQAAKRDIPHFYLAVDVEVDALLAAREHVNANAAAEGRVSVNDLLIRAAALGLTRVPEANVRWIEERSVPIGSVDVAIAVALESDGLLTPVIRRADGLSAVEIGSRARAMAARARNGTLLPGECDGGSITITNLGMYGIDRFTAIINPPQAMILAVGAARRCPVVRRDELVIATVMGLTLSVDHRVIDGAPAARFLGALRALLESPDVLFAGDEARQ